MKLPSSFLMRMYRIDRRLLRAFVRRQAARQEGGEHYSLTLRKLFKVYHEVDIGLYTHGGCFLPGAMDRFTTIGRYCSTARPVRSMNRNHPMEYKSMHAFFFNPKLKRCKEDRIEYTPLTVGNDVWLGAGAWILPHTRVIGDGAVIGAGAVINKDVPPYGVVVGNPGRVIRFRFPKDVIEELLASRWWDKPVEELNIDEFTRAHIPAEAQGDGKGEAA